MHSRSRSAWPQCRAYSSTMCTTMSRTSTWWPSRSTVTPRSSTPAQVVLRRAYLRPPGREGLLDHRGVGHRRVEVGVAVLVLAEQPGLVLALDLALEPAVLDRGHVPHQAQQRHRGRRHRAPRELLGVQAVALHLERLAVVVEVLRQHCLLASGLLSTSRGSSSGSTHMSGYLRSLVIRVACHACEYVVLSPSLPSRWCRSLGVPPPRRPRRRRRRRTTARSSSPTR